MNDSFEFECHFNPELIPGVDLLRPMRPAGQPILDLITAGFPPGQFRYACSRRAKPFGGANHYQSGKTNMAVCLFVINERTADGWLQGTIVAWRLGRGILRRRPPLTSEDIQVMDDLREKIEAVLSSNPQIRMEQLSQTGD